MSPRMMKMNSFSDAKHISDRRSEKTKLKNAISFSLSLSLTLAEIQHYNHPIQGVIVPNHISNKHNMGENDQTRIIQNLN